MNEQDKAELEELAENYGKGVKLSDEAAMSDFIGKAFKRQGSKVQDANGVIEFLTRRSVLPDSFYHLFMPNEVSLANLTRGDLERVDLHMQVIDQGVYMAKRGLITWDIPLTDAAEFLSWLNSTRAIGMLHEKLMATNTLNVHKSEESKGPPGVLDRFKPKKD